MFSDSSAGMYRLSNRNRQKAIKFDQRNLQLDQMLWMAYAGKIELVIGRHPLKPE